MSTEAARGSWHILVPVKRLDAAKSRLTPVPDVLRRELSLAFALDTVAAAAGAARSGSVTVVTLDDEVAEAAARLGAAVLPDLPDDGIVAALRYAEGVLRAQHVERVAALAGDLPALRPGLLDAALLAADEHPRSFVPDAAGTGTVLLAAHGAGLDPRFGPRSCAAHAASGAVRLDLPGAAGLRRDVDTEVDLWDALRLGTGPATSAVTAAHRA